MTVIRTDFGLTEGHGFTRLEDTDLGEAAVNAAHAAFGYLADIGFTNKPGVFTALSWRDTEAPGFRRRIASAAVNRHLWPEDRDYEKIADSKGTITGRTGLNSGDVVEKHPGLLLPTDKYKYRGAVILPVDIRVKDIVVVGELVCETSGVQSDADDGISQTAGGIFIVGLKLRAKELAGV